MNLPHSPQAVIFDMDGLLIDTVPIYIKAMVQASLDVGHPLSDTYFFSLVGLLGKELEARMLSDQGAAFPLADFFSRMSARLEPLLMSDVTLKPGARVLITDLANRGLPLAVATSMKKAEATHHLGNFGLNGFFQHVVGRDDVANSKPHPDIHLKAAANLGIDPHFCVVLEDSFNGVKAAHSAGAMPIMVPDVLQPTEEIKRLCVCIASTLNQVKTILSAT